MASVGRCLVGWNGDSRLADTGLLAGEEVAVREPSVAHDDVAKRVADRGRETGAARDEGMEFATLAARVDARRQVAEQRAVERAAGERCIEQRRVHANQPRLEAAVDELVGQRARRAAPDWEQPGKAQS